VIRLAGADAAVRARRLPALLWAASGKQPGGQQQTQPPLVPASAHAFRGSRAFRNSAAPAGEVVVPAMGDSITEGSVAAVLKQPGARSRLLCVCVCVLPRQRAALPHVG
jgi:hypothetical protein